MKLIAEVIGIGSAMVGAWLIFPPAALIAAGVGLVLWAQGGDE